MLQASSFMRFQVPQFIEVEDKIFGPLTLKQFIYLLGGGAAIFLLYIFLPFFIFIILATPVGAFTAALAFFKVNNRSFIKFTESAFKHLTRSKTYIWKKKDLKAIKKIKITKKTPAGKLPAITEKKLEDLAWSLDIRKK